MATALEVGLGFGLLFAPLAGLMAFLITYREYRRHSPDRRAAVRADIEVGVVTLGFVLEFPAAASILAGRIYR